MLRGHGDDGYRYPKIVANFSSNVYQHTDFTALKNYLCTNINAIHAYPEPDAFSLAKLIAAQHQLEPGCIGITNGATEAIYLIAQAFQQNKSAILCPTFSEYGDAAAIHQHYITPFFSLENLPEQCDLVWICHPNNPTGKSYAIERLKKAFIEHPKTCFVIDQSYAAFTRYPLLVAAEIINYPNVILLHSLTKCFAIPGLRLGYFIANRLLSERISHYRMPWSVNSLAILAGKYLLSHPLPFQLAPLLAQSKQLQQALNQLPFLEVLPSDTHYFLVKLLDKTTAAQLKDYLAKEHHVLIRDASNFVGLTDKYFRVASQNESQNALLVQAIQCWFNIKT